MDFLGGHIDTRSGGFRERGVHMSTISITTVTLTVTLVRFSTPETKKPQRMLGFQRSYMAVG